MDADNIPFTLESKLPENERQRLDAMREELPKIIKDLNEYSEEVIENLRRCRDYLEAQDEHKKAADIDLRLLPYIIAKKKELEDLANGGLVCELTLNINNNGNSLNALLQQAQERDRQCIYWRNVCMDAGAVSDLLSAYEDATGLEYNPDRAYKTVHDRMRQRGLLLTQEQREKAGFTKRDAMN